MPKRPRSHEIEELSRTRLRAMFAKLGWVVWDLQPDYGEDLLVRIFTNGVATHYSFFVQAKATEHIERYLDKDGKHISFPIDVEHLYHWEQFWEPVVLTVWDGKSDVTYWEVVQNCFRLNEEEKTHKKIFRVSIPIANILDIDGLESIRKQTITRFQRFELTCEGVQALVSYIEEKIDVKVDYEPGYQVIIFDYYSKDTGERLTEEMILMGQVAKMLNQMAEYENRDPEQLFIEILNDGLMKKLRELNIRT